MNLFIREDSLHSYHFAYWYIYNYVGFKSFKNLPLLQLEEERKIPKEKILDAIEQVMAAAYKKRLRQERPNCPGKV